MQFVVIRLGKDSINDIHRLNDHKLISNVPFSFPFTCAQVEDGIDVGDFAFVWLGSDNNKGQPTAWKQGLRAIGKITSLIRTGGFNDPSNIEIEVVAIFPKSIDQFDFLERSASHYKYFSKYPVIGVKSSRNNAIQKVNEEDRQKTSALLTAISIQYPSIRKQLAQNAPELLPLLNFVPIGDTISIISSKSILSDTDEIWQWVTHEIFQKKERNFLFIGPPGTGKTWYAHEIAKKLVNNDKLRYEFVQFHPSFSYDDFVEGYTPRPSSTGNSVEYSIKSKHFLKMCDKARSDGSNLYVIVIDELSRGDPSRVFGELLTYIETEYRNKEFSLAYSGNKSFIPDNIVIIATANPYDRSVGEMDDALIRRFVLREFLPSSDSLQKHLSSKLVPNDLIYRIIHVFNLINNKLPHGFGHSHFWNIRTEEDFRDLWSSRIQFLLKRAFLFEENSFLKLKSDIEDVFPSFNNKKEEKKKYIVSAPGESNQ